MAYQDNGYYFNRGFGYSGYESYWWRKLEQEERDAAAQSVFTKTISYLLKKQNKLSVQTNIIYVALCALTI